MGAGGEKEEGTERQMEDKDRGEYKGEEGRHRQSKGSERHDGMKVIQRDRGDKKRG